MVEIQIVGTNNLIQQLQTIHNNLPHVMERALDVAANRMVQAKQREARRTYERPVPTSANGNPKWTRTGNLLSEITVESAPGVRSIVNRGNSEAYEEHLATIGPGKDGVNRANPAAANAQAIVEPQIQAIFEQELLNLLGY